MSNKPMNEQPLYQRIHTHLKQRIEDGEWAHGAVLPSEFELCELYHISRGTVRQVLARLEEEKLVRRERGRGTFVTRPTTQKPANGMGNHSIAFIVPYVRDSFVSTILLGLESIARANGYVVVFSHVENDLEKQELALRQAIQQEISGIILYPVNSKDTTPTLLDLAQKDFPLLLVDRYIRGLYTDFVASDNFGGGLLATRHLLRLGHRRIAFLSWKEPATSKEHRKVGYRQALIEAGIPLNPDLEWEVIGYPDIDQGALAEQMAQPERPTAIFAANDQLAIAVQRVARTLKLNIPQDLALVGFDNLEISAQLDIPLTTVAQAAFDLGKVAGKLVMQKIGRTSIHLQQSILPTQLIVRSSCGYHQASNLEGGHIGQILKIG